MKQEKEFFITMHRPIDFGQEIGGSLDGRQLIVMGNASLILGALLGLIVLVPNEPAGRLLSAGVSGVIVLIGIILKRRGRNSI